MKFQKTTFFLLLAIASSLSALSCKSEDDNPCGGNNVTGGFGEILYKNSYIFWTNVNDGVLTVEVKDAKGNIQPADHHEIEQYYHNSDGPSQHACSVETRRNNAVFSLERGKKYTYRAFNDFRRFEGTIDLTCEQNQCFYVRVGPGIE